MNRHWIGLAILIACKKQEAVPTPTVTIDTAIPSVTAVAISSTEPIASATPSASASAAPSAAADAIERRRQALREAAEFGMLGILGETDAGSFGGGEGIGLGNIGIGNGHSDGGAAYGIRGSGRSPTLRMGALTVSGRMAPEIIQRVVRQNFGRFRLCYENGLRSNPSLEGKAITRFVIGTDGSVTTTQDASSDLPDTNVVDCIRRAFGNLSFPQPAGGIVIVTAPIILAPAPQP